MKSLPWILLAALLFAPTLEAQSFGDRITRMRAASRQDRPVKTPPGTRAILNVAYGRDQAQRFDIWLPARARNAPVIFYVHGGGWANGGKDNPGIENKLAYWIPKGYAVVSTNYRLVPDADPVSQAKDVARALAIVQSRAREWQIDDSRVVLMGHSAGAHLVALLGADPRLLRESGARRPLGVVSLDSGALNVPSLMSQRRVPQLYKNAFGDNPRYWAKSSPYDQLARNALPMLIVCSSTRHVPTSPCDEGRAFADKAQRLGVSMRVLPEAMDHGEINHDLGEPSAYTRDVARTIAAWVN